MAKNVVVQVLGGDKQVVDGCDTLGELKERVNAKAYTAVVNGDPESNDYDLVDGDFVSLSQAVKGGLI